MSGEEKRTRSKRYLSRTKRSKAEKCTGDDPSSEVTGEAYAIFKSQHEPLNNENGELTEETSVVKVLPGQTRNDEKDVYEFHVEDIDDGNVESTGPVEKNKRKRISSEELEVSCFSSTVSRFKRARNAVTFLKQPSIQLEKCTGSEITLKGESCARNKTVDCTEVLSHKLDKSDNSLQEVAGKTSVLSTHRKVRDICNDSIGQVHVGTDDLQAKHNFKFKERKEDSSKDCCPVCSLVFLPTENIDVINRHINSCLDSGSDCRTTKKSENDSSESGREKMGEEMFFCQLCQKDLSKMNSQRRLQHINRCCDEESKSKDATLLSENRVQGQTCAQFQCPICGKGFKSSKSRQAHLKKCAQEYNVGTNQLLEILQREKLQEGSTSVAAIGTDAKTATEATNEKIGRVKRKKRAVAPKSDLDEQTQIALALSASMAPPPPADSSDGKTVKRKGKKNKGGNELPPLLLRDDETAQRAMALRAAQVLCTQEDNTGEDDEISCTPALAPSRLAQNVNPSCQPPLSKDDAGCNSDSETTSVWKEELSEAMNIDSENGNEQDTCKQLGVSAFAVDPSLSKSFLNFLYDVEDEERQAAEVQASRPSPLWSLAALKEHSSATFYVQGLLSPASPLRTKNCMKKATAPEGGKVPAIINELPIDAVETSKNNSLLETKERPESVMDEQLSPMGDTGECPEITPSQAVNVEMLLELAEDDDILNTSVVSQQIFTASGFCVDEQDEKTQKSDTVPSGVPKLLQDLSSMINNPQLSDVVIHLKDGQEIVAHSFILSLRSDVLAQLLSGEKTLRENAVSTCSRWQDKLCLKFQDVRRPVFEVVLRHIYAGDVTIPALLDLDDISNLAARLNLHCLLKACNALREQMNHVFESQEDDDISNCLATDLEKLEENIWRNVDDQLSDIQREKDGENDFLNDDDIEEIMLFQTQALKRKDSIECEDLEVKQPKFLPDLSEDILAKSEESTVAGKANSDDFHESSGSKSVENIRETSESSASVKGDLSRNAVEEGSISRYNATTDDIPQNLAVTNGLSCTSVDNREITLPNDFTEEQDEDQGLVSCEVDEERTTENKQSCSLKEHLTKKETDGETDQVVHVLTKLKEKPEKRSWDDRLLSRDASSGIPCQRKPICELTQNQIKGSREKTALGQRFEVAKEVGVSVNENILDDGGDCRVEFELENNEHSAMVPKGSFSNEFEREADRLKEVDDVGTIYETLSEIKLHRDEDFDFPNETTQNHADCSSPPAGEVFWDNDTDFRGSSREVTVSDDDEIEVIGADESITLLSDREEEDFDDSPPKADVTVVPETPRVTRNARQHTSSSSLSALSVSEEDVTVTGFSPSKTRKQLNEEASDFLSKLKQRVERDKDKRRGKGKRKKNIRTREFLGERSVKRTTARKRSPRARQENSADTSPFPCDLPSSIGSGQERTCSSMGEFPRGLETSSNLPLRESRSDDEPRSVTPERMSPRCSQHSRSSPILLRENFAADCVVFEHSPPLSPDLFQPQHELPQYSAFEEKGVTKSSELCKRDSLGGNKFNFDNLDDVTIVETCADKAAPNLSMQLGLSTSSSPREVMSPPVPSPEYSFLEPVSSPGSPVRSASPVQNKIVSSPDSVSPGLPVTWKSTQSESGPDACAQSNCPMSPSVCSFSSQIAGSSRKSRKEESASRKLDLGSSLNKNENTEPTAEVREIDPNLPLMERIRAARGAGGNKIIYKVTDFGEDSSETDSDKDCTEDKIESNKKQSPRVSSQQDTGVISTVEINEVENFSMDANFYDDGGYNFDVEELQNLERLENANKADSNEQGESHSKEDKLSQQEKASKAIGNKRKIPPRQQKEQGFEYTQKTQKKRTKKADVESETNRPTVQTVKGPVTPMPNYNDMATPALKNELQKFGVRPLPKKKMIRKLKEIFVYTHPVEPLSLQSEAEPAVSDSQPASSNVVQTDVVDGMEDSGTASSDNSEDEGTEFGDCTVMIEEEGITASQQVNGSNLKEKLFSYIQSNKELYKKILTFQPLELLSLHQQIKSDGINCAFGKLVDFLDEQCITFTTAGSRPRAPRKGGRKKKINKKH